MVIPCHIHLKCLLREDAGAWTEAGGRNANRVDNAPSLYFVYNMHVGQNHFCSMSLEITVSTINWLKLADSQAS